MYRYAKRPNELYSSIYKTSKAELKKGESRRFLLFLVVTKEILESSVCFPDRSF